MSYQALIAETGETFEIHDDETILQAARRSSAHISYQCEIGVCATCRIKLSKGSVSYVEPIDTLTEEEIIDGYVLACRAQAKSDLIFHSERRLPVCSESTQFLATILEISLITSDVYKLILDLGEARDFTFRPGQYANILIGGNIQRSFSIAGRSNLGRFEFLIKKIPDGIFTDKFLGQSQVGDHVKVEIPFGTFAYHADDYKPLIFAANGTGIAPIKCILNSLLVDEDCPPIKVYWGVRKEEDLFLTQEIALWAKHFDDFEFIPVLSKPTKNWSGRVGHVQNVVLDDFPDLSEFAIYLCGSPNMIQDATAVFCSANANLSQLYLDAFNFQKEL
jgi:CDP-4-dehydro-6-deoxyglucose reductase